MCGITGIYNYHKNNEVNTQLLKEVTQLIAHRGPDEDGYFTKDNIGLGHKRLSIIDVADGKQPMFSHDNNYIITYNGEIYNYLEVREELIQHGFHFSTNSDTEVILNSYIHWGKDCLLKFNGMWSFAIWNGANQELFVARDRLGIKPLYYINNKDLFAFASEIKAFKPLMNFEINNIELWDMLVFGPKYGGKTHIKNVIELSPGSCMIVNENGLRIDRYFKIEETFDNVVENVDYENLEFLIEDSIKKRLLSEVPLGTLNSGGLDSSLISFYASNHFPDTLKTFSIAPFSKNGQILDGDESMFAEKIAKSINSNHLTIRYSDNDFFDLLDSSIYFNDGLLFHSNSIPMSIMFEKIKNQHHTTVLLGGEGADEIFRGYTINQLYLFYKLSKKSFLTEKLFRNYLKKKYPKLASSKVLSKYPFVLKLILLNKSQFTESIASTLLDFEGNLSEDRLRLLEISGRLSESNQMILYDQTCYLSGLLQRVDRMSMRWGIEVRVPFLDHRIVECLNQIPLSAKVGFKEKSVKKLLKRVAKNKIPNEIVFRQKYGFSSPLNVYKPQFVSILNNEAPREIYNNMSDQEIFLFYNLLKMK